MDCSHRNNNTRSPPTLTSPLMRFDSTTTTNSGPGSLLQSGPRPRRASTKSRDAPMQLGHVALLLLLCPPASSSPHFLLLLSFWRSATPSCCCSRGRQAGRQAGEQYYLPRPPLPPSGAPPHHLHGGASQGLRANPRRRPRAVCASPWGPAAARWILPGRRTWLDSLLFSSLLSFSALLSQLLPLWPDARPAAVVREVPVPTAVDDTTPAIREARFSTRAQEEASIRCLPRK